MPTTFKGPDAHLPALAKGEGLVARLDYFRGGRFGASFVCALHCARRETGNGKGKRRAIGSFNGEQCLCMVVDTVLCVFYGSLEQFQASPGVQSRLLWSPGLVCRVKVLVAAVGLGMWDGVPVRSG